MLKKKSFISKAAIDNAISHLLPQQKLVFTLCKIEGKTYEEVSLILNISTSTINSHIVAATKKIRQIIFDNSTTAAIITGLIMLYMANITNLIELTSL